MPIHDLFLRFHSLFGDVHIVEIHSSFFTHLKLTFRVGKVNIVLTIYITITISLNDKNEKNIKLLSFRQFFQLNKRIISEITEIRRKIQTERTASLGNHLGKLDGKCC